MGNEIKEKNGTIGAHEKKIKEQDERIFQLTQTQQQEKKHLKQEKKYLFIGHNYNILVKDSQQEKKDETEKMVIRDAQLGTDYLQKKVKIFEEFYENFFPESKEDKLIFLKSLRKNINSKVQTLKSEKEQLEKMSIEFAKEKAELMNRQDSIIKSFENKLEVNKADFNAMKAEMDILRSENISERRDFQRDLKDLRSNIKERDDKIEQLKLNERSTINNHRSEIEETNDKLMDPMVTDIVRPQLDDMEKKALGKSDSKSERRLENIREFRKVLK